MTVDANQGAGALSSPQTLTSPERLVRLEAKYEAMEDRLNSLHDGDTKVFKWILVLFGSLMTLTVGLVGGLSYFSYTSNYEKIDNNVKSAKATLDAEVSKIEPKIEAARNLIDQLSHPQPIDTATVIPIGSLLNSLRATPSFSYFIYSFDKREPKLVFEFRVSIDVTGPGIGKLTGLFVRFDHLFVAKFLGNDFAGNESFATMLESSYLQRDANNDNQNTNVVLIKHGTPYTFVWNISIADKSCDRLKNIVNSFNTNYNGTVLAIPVFEQINHYDIPPPFNIEIGHLSVHDFSCEELNNHK